MIKLMPFQEDAITKLSSVFKKLWKDGRKGADIVFKSPTGSGKTIMMAQFLKDLTQDPLFDVDKCFIWISFGGNESYKQSKEKLSKFYDGAGVLNLLDLNDISKKKMKNNDVFFINWSKIKAGNKEGRVLRAETENTMKGVDGGVFDEFILNTQAEGREIVLIVDESHLETGTGLSDEVVNLIKPKLEIHISATPKNIPNREDEEDLKRGYVRVKHSDVVDAGLIKEKIITQTEEDISKTQSSNIDNVLLDLAISKRAELKKDYLDLGIKNINPLVLIQIPNKNKKDDEFEEETRQALIKDYLQENGVKDSEIAVWLSETKENLEDIVKNDSEISYLIFKQAVATGWDCPRAQVLVMYREIKNPTFHTQTVGRVLRMPEAKHYSIGTLNQAYLYTNYKRNDIHKKEGALGDNKLSMNKSFRKKEIKPISLQSINISRVDYNDLKPSPQFQLHLMREFDDYFGTSEIFTLFDENVKKLEGKGLKLNRKNSTVDILVNAEVENYDNFFSEIQYANEMGISISNYDMQRMYDKLCYDILTCQENEKAKYAPERSWSTLKKALNVWFMARITDNRNEAYNIIVNDLMSQNSTLKIILEKVLIEFRPISDEFLKKQSERKRTEVKIEIPLAIDSFSDDYIIKDYKKSAVEPFYIPKEKRLGQDNEESFINYLEAQENVKWWYKNGDSGNSYFSIPRTDNKGLFYPDWFIMLNNGKFLILDTKKGFTATNSEAKPRIEALHNYLSEQGLDINFTAGIVIKHSDIWKININKVYDDKDNYSDFIPLDDILC